MFKDHTEKENFFLVKENTKKIGTDCRNLREMIKRKREKDWKQKVRNIFLNFFKFLIFFGRKHKN